MSTNGHWVVFSSDANNLVVNDTNGYRDVFVRDMLLQTNILVSAGTNGFAGSSGASSEPSISGDGRYVAFSSFATNIVGNDTNLAQDVFLRDLQAGTNSLVSVSVKGGFANGASFSPIISQGGRFVLYHSLATNLTTNTVSALENLFLRDLQTGTNFALTTNGLLYAAMTLDGRHVAFVGIGPGSTATSLYVWDSLTAKRIYTNSSANITNVGISPDGRWVACSTNGTLFAHDLIGNVDVKIGSGPFGFHTRLQFSIDDRFLLYTTTRKVLAADTNLVYEVFLHDFQTGTNFLVSQSYNSASAAAGATYSATISPDGRFVAYVSRATNVVPVNGNGAVNLYLYDRVNQATLLVSVNAAGFSTANMASVSPIFSGDSSNLVFESYASNLAAPGFNEYSAIFSMGLSDQAVGSAGGDGMTGQWNVQFLNPATAGQNPVLSWPVAAGVLPGGSYRVQYKNSLSDPAWLNLNGSATVVGTQGRATDLAPAGQRFYRILLTY